MAALSLERYENDLLFLWIHTKRVVFRFPQILEKLLIFCNGGYNVHRVFSLGATLV